MVVSGSETFTVGDLHALSDLVSATWMSAAGADWSVPAGTMEWSCLATADHAVDGVYAPSFFLASRRTDDYPVAGGDLTLGATATPEHIVESLGIATRILAAVVNETAPDVRSIIFRRPQALVGTPGDFVPRAAVELILHAHDVCVGLAVPFEPPAAMCRRLREHTRRWPIWGAEWQSLADTDDPWADILTASGRVTSQRTR